MIDVNVLLEQGAAYKKINAGEVIFSEGITCNFYYQLVSGKVKWINIDDTGKECIHLIVEPGESFGEFPLFDDKPYAASAIAETDAVLLRLYKPVFLELLNKNNEILFKFIRLFAGRLRAGYILASISSHSPENRIAALINNLRSENRNICPDCGQLKLTRQQIANMTGLRVETVIRTIRDMHNKGDLQIIKGKVYCKKMIRY
jgi:CRP/FNR family cyclic AMP-dependent transcriptional regulator